MTYKCSLSFSISLSLSHSRSRSAPFSECCTETMTNVCAHAAPAQYAQPKLHVSFSKTHRIKSKRDDEWNIMRWILKLDLCEFACHILHESTVYITQSGATIHIGPTLHTHLNCWGCFGEVLSWFVLAIWVCVCLRILFILTRLPEFDLCCWCFFGLFTS